MREAISVEGTAQVDIRPALPSGFGDKRVTQVMQARG
jgi:hypothetical protein